MPETLWINRVEEFDPLIILLDTRWKKALKIGFLLYCSVTNFKNTKVREHGSFDPRLCHRPERGKAPHLVCTDHITPIPVHLFATQVGPVVSKYRSSMT